MNEVYREPISGQPIRVNEDYEIDWRGTIGVGDILYGLNAAHALSKMYDHPIKMNVFWEHDEDYVYHYEDPETIIERTHILEGMYHNAHNVTVNHIFNSTDEEIKKLRWRGFGHQRHQQKVLTFHHWLFRKELFQRSRNKVVFWRPTFNREIPSGGKKWKMTFSVKEWERIIMFLELKGYELVELSYRTPVREAIYHISTSKFCIFYDGMWQYIARNFCKPVITLGGSSIAKVHSPQGVHFSKPHDPDNCFWDYLYRLPENEKHLEGRARRYKKQLMDKIDDF
ncbi:MAG: hypothetical protein HOL29_09310 [Euryarchaeota archaeon]|jgi:hypothetical protein|nr:hypothetical protein [Euryarchaeota archaeon]